MFQFPAFAYALLRITLRLGCPIRTSTDQWMFAPPRRFSQLITSFFASERLGILHTPFSYFLYFFLFLVSFCFSLPDTILLYFSYLSSFSSSVQHAIDRLCFVSLAFYFRTISFYNSKQFLQYIRLRFSSPLYFSASA